jgi:hypothetical protein
MKEKRIAITAFILIVTITLISCGHATQSPRESTIEVATSATPDILSDTPPGGVEIGTDTHTDIPDKSTSGIQATAHVKKVIGTPEWVVLAFLDEVSEGDLIGAKRFWEPYAWNTGIEQLVAGWASARHEFSIGAVSYAGFVAPGDYRPLEADDPRVLGALVAASIDGFPGSFALEKTSSGWLISGWIEPDKLEE